MFRIALGLILIAAPALAEQQPPLPIEAQLALARTNIGDTLQRFAGTILAQAQEIETLKAQVASMKAERDAPKTEATK